MRLRQIIFVKRRRPENVHDVARLGVTVLEPGVHRLAFEREHTEHALVRASQGLSPHKTLERLQPKGKLTKCE